ncbi:MAG: methyltransferase domain-containing protein [Chloroflexota bacterium]
MAQDIYTRLDDLDAATLRNITNLLERRGQHPQQVAIRQAYLDALGDLTGLSVLDAGCGTGVVTRDLARRVGPGGAVLGVDPSAGMVAVAEDLAAQMGVSGVSFLVQDGRRLPHADATFDLTCAVTVLSHVPEREALVHELVRVTKPGGRLLVVDGDFAANQLAHPDAEMTARIIEAWRTNIVDDPYVARRLTRLLIEAGLWPGPTNGYVHVEAGRVEEDTSFLWQWCPFAVEQAIQAGAITRDEATGWLDAVQRLNDDHQFFGSVNFVGVVSTRL